MNSSRVVVIKVCRNWFIQVGHWDNPRQQILQHTEEEHAHITIILANSSMPVATCCSPSAIAVPCMDSHIPDEEGRILHLLVHRIPGSCQKPLELRNFMEGTVWYPIEAVSGVSPVQVGSIACNPCISVLNNPVPRLVCLGCRQSLHSWTASRMFFQRTLWHI